MNPLPPRPNSSAPFPQLVCSRREFARRLAGLGLVTGLAPWPLAAAEAPAPPDPALTFPGPWAFSLPKGGIILVSDAQLEELQDPDREIDLSLSSTPNRTTLRKFCEQQRASGARTVILAFDEFFSQYRPGQGGKPRRLMPDTDDYIRCVARISETLKAHGLGLELSLLSPLELGPGYRQRTGESGRWVQYREGLRDPQTGHYEVQLWEHRRWTNNKGSIALRRAGVRVFAFREKRVGNTHFHAVAPADIVELREAPTLEEWPGATFEAGTSFAARRLTVRGTGEPGLGPLDRVMVVVAYETPEMDYFSPKAMPFLKELVDRYHQAGVPLNGSYADEMHIQQDWVYHTHHDEGQFTLRYLTPNLARTFAAQYGPEFADLEKYLVYFAYGQHGFLPGLEARDAAQHVLGASPVEVQRTFLLRRHYYDLLTRTVVGLFAGAKRYAEEKYGHELESRAHATWAQSPTIDRWETGPAPQAPHQYEYTPNFRWSNTVQQTAAACDDYFRWNDFLTGGGNDHAEGGWSDRDYYALALACSTGILNRTPYAYAAHWGLPGPAGERRQALVDAYGAAASPAFQAIEQSEHRDVEVLMLYPLSLVACEERFGSWMTQYGYANYVTPDVLLERGRVTGGAIEMAGRRFTTVAVLFEPLPPAGLLPLLETFVNGGGRLVWSGPPPRLDGAGQDILERWQKLCGVRRIEFAQQGLLAPDELIAFEGALKPVPTQTIPTHFLVDHVYPVEPDPEAAVVARNGARIVGTHRTPAGGGSATFLGFRPRDDQAASLGYEVRTWFEILRALGAYPPSQPGLSANDNPSVVSRESPWLACRFPNGTTTIAVHYKSHVESWPGGFHRDPARDAEVLQRNPLPSDRLELAGGLRVNGVEVRYTGRLLVAFRRSASQRLIAFGGYDCATITLDQREHRFATAALRHIAWTPVAPPRRVPGGAVLEMWIDGDAELTIPVEEPTAQGKLFHAGPRPGSLGAEVTASLRDGVLRFANTGSRHLFLI